MTLLEPLHVAPAKLRRWALNVASGYASALVGGIIYILLTPFLIERLGLESYGVLIICHTLTFYLEFLDFGIGGAQIRYHARFAARGRDEDVRRLTSTVTSTLVVAGLGATLLGLMIAATPSTWWINSGSGAETDFRLVMTILAITLLISFPSSALDNLYVGAERFDIRNLRSIALQILTAGTQLALLSAGFGIVALVVVELVAACALVLLDIVILKRLLPGVLQIRINIDRRIWQQIRRFAFWNFLDDLLMEGSTRVGTILVAIFLPLAVLAPYTLTITVAGMLLLAAHPITNTFLPLATSLHARHKRTELVQLLVAGTKGLVALAAIVAIPLAAFGESIIHLWVPETREQMLGPLMPIVLADILISVFLATPAVILVAANRMRVFVLLTLAELALTIVLMLLLVPSFGVVGMATAALIANVSMGIGFQIPIVSRIVGIDTGTLVARTLIRILAACIPGMALAVYLRSIWAGSGWLALVGAAVVGCTCLIGVLLMGATGSERSWYIEWWRNLWANHSLE